MDKEINTDQYKKRKLSSSLNNDSIKIPEASPFSSSSLDDNFLDSRSPITNLPKNEFKDIELDDSAVKKVKHKHHHKHKHGHGCKKRKRGPVDRYSSELGMLIIFVVYTNKKI